MLSMSNEVLISREILSTLALILLTRYPLWHNDTLTCNLWQSDSDALWHALWHILLQALWHALADNLTVTLSDTFSLTRSVWRVLSDTLSQTIQGDLPPFSTTNLQSTSQQRYDCHWHAFVWPMHTRVGPRTGDVLGYTIPLQWSSNTATELVFLQYQ